MSRLAELLGTDRPVLLDGGMGTLLQDAGLEDGAPGELWNLENPDAVRAAHAAYADAGARILTTNTFGGTRPRLDMHGLADRASPVERPWIPMVDHIHCAGVLHHTADPMSILKDFHRLLRPEGEVRVMIYDGDRSTHSESEVPITKWWRETEFKHMAYIAGFDTDYMGSYECSAPWRPNCFAACYRMTCQR